MRNLLLLSVILASSEAIADTAPCDMSLSFNHPDNEGSSAVAVWRSPDKKSLVFVDRMNVNTDGTRRSYSVDDFWGETQALNNLCNAMSDKCSGLSKDQMRQRRIATQQAKANGWPVAETSATKISPSIIPFRNGKPCPEVGGYLVSATALHRPQISDVCDISNYVDALKVPAIVLPGRAMKGVPSPFETAGAQVGDLVVTMRMDGSDVYYAVVGDIGPAKEIGEISVALAGELLGKTTDPASYQEIRGRNIYKGKGWTVGQTITLIFPGTKKVSNPYLTRVQIQQDAADRFAAWGGIGRLKSCKLAYK